MQKEKGIVSIKVKLLGVIVPVVIVSILVLVLIAYRTSAGLIESYFRESAGVIGGESGVAD